MKIPLDSSKFHRRLSNGIGILRGPGSIAKSVAADNEGLKARSEIRVFCAVVFELLAPPFIIHFPWGGAPELIASEDHSHGLFAVSGCKERVSSVS